MIRKTLVATIGIGKKADPDYTNLNCVMDTSVKKGLRVVSSQVLRVFVAAFRDNLKELPEPLYTAIRADNTRFEKFLEEYFESINKSLPLARFKYWVNSGNRKLRTDAEVASRFGITPQAVNRSNRAVCDIITSTRFLTAAASAMRIQLVAKNTTDYKQVKELLKAFSVHSKRATIVNAESEKVRAMLLLYRNHVDEFDEAAYDRLLIDHNARTAVELQIYNLLPSDYAQAVKLFLGIGCFPTPAALIAERYGISKSTVYRKVDYVMNALVPQLVIS